MSDSPLYYAYIYDIMLTISVKVIGILLQVTTKNGMIFLKLRDVVP
jgi:hypothetical protein